MRLVAWARERGHERAYELLAPQLAGGVLGRLDALLVADPRRSGRTPLSWLRSRPSSVSAGALRRELDKRAYLHELLGATGSMWRCCPDSSLPRLIFMPDER